MTLNPCSYSQSHNCESSTTRPRLDDMCEEITEGFPRMDKRKIVKRARSTEDGLEALAKVAAVAKERAEATITTSDSIIAQEALKGDVNGRWHLTSVAPPTEQPNLIDIKSELSDNDLVDFRGLAMVPRHHASLLERECISTFGHVLKEVLEMA
ncbi:hypothetical protein TB2_034085 [Malus domestica]